MATADWDYETFSDTQRTAVQPEVRLSYSCSALSHWGRYSDHSCAARVRQKFCEGTGVAQALAASLTSQSAGRPPLESARIRLSLFEGCPSIAIRDHNTAIGILAAKAKHAYFGQNPAETREHLHERVCSAAVAYAGSPTSCPRSVQALPVMISVAFTGEATPYLAFGSTITEMAGSAEKERLRRLRELEIRQAHSDVVFQREPLSTNGGRDGQRLGHCAEPTALLHSGRILTIWFEYCLVASRKLIASSPKTADFTIFAVDIVSHDLHIPALPRTEAISLFILWALWLATLSGMYNVMLSPRTDHKREQYAFILAKFTLVNPTTPRRDMDGVTLGINPSKNWAGSTNSLSIPGTNTERVNPCLRSNIQDSRDTFRDNSPSCIKSCHNRAVPLVCNHRISVSAQLFEVAPRHGACCVFLGGIQEFPQADPAEQWEILSMPGLSRALGSWAVWVQGKHQASKNRQFQRAEQLTETGSRGSSSTSSGGKWYSRVPHMEYRQEGPRGYSIWRIFHRAEIE
ncbi:hypothetical protein B0H13DRAFT_1905408 [Mycena leptocephala]|nr:hypothetical protein B0H13DRAFT_1905408 [Mycena leptocephala]